jgi:hypothetical protein
MGPRYRGSDATVDSFASSASPLAIEPTAPVKRREGVSNAHGPVRFLQESSASYHTDVVPSAGDGRPEVGPASRISEAHPRRLPSEQEDEEVPGIFQLMGEVAAVALIAAARSVRGGGPKAYEPK